MMQYINVSKIHSHPDNPRKDLGDLTELAESIKANGILQNLTVVPWFSKITGVGCDDAKQQEEMGYIAVIGHRRLAAAKIAGLTEVPCMVSDMSHRQQVATMLTENIQRSDLTIYEQAQGFQMMLNFGDSVHDIAGRTGFSDTTIRRRVKLLDLDGEKFRKSVERGATLLDYAELDKIKDSELKNKVLDKIGTPNFKYELDKAVGDEKIAENKAKLLEQLEQFATQVKERDNNSMRYVAGYYPSRDSKVTVPDDADTTEYFFVVSTYGGIDLYTKQVQGKADSKEAERRNKQQARKAALDEITTRAHKLRGDFIRGISAAKAKSSMGIIIQYLLRGTLDCYSEVDSGDFVDFLGVDTGISDDQELEFDDIVGFIEKQPERCLLIATYLNLESDRNSYYTWEGQHKDDDELNTVYDFLEELGYEMSDEEYAMSNGSHELFREEQSV